MESRLGKEWSFELRVVCETCESSNVLFIEKRSSYRGNFFLLETFYRLKYRQSVGGRNDILLEFVFYVVKYRRKKICVLVIFHFCELLRILIRRTSVS